MLARLQQFITIALLGLASGWLAWHWSATPAIALAGFFLIAFGYSGFLAVEFIALRFISRSDPAPKPTWSQLLGAWAGETLTAPKVFCWRQPFRSNQIPDSLAPSLHGKRGVVFIHGFVCNRGFWTPWLRELKARGHAFAAVNLEPVFGSIDDYTPVVDEAVERVTQTTGMPPVLVCHSMGGLAARGWLRTLQADDRVFHVVTIGTPHRGTWLGQFSRVSNGSQMWLKSQWLGELGKYATEKRHASFTCWYSNCDNIVFPASTATLPGADNRHVPGVAHVCLGFHPEVMATTLAKIAAL
jgi:pimeloyl-ACP methyl ester carboxylesterase